MIPREIKREHILLALAHAEAKDFRRRGRFQLTYEGQCFAPKDIISQASRFALGEILPLHAFSGGEEANRFLERLGFCVAERGHYAAPPAPSPSLRIARAVLDLAVTQGELKSLGVDGWTAHRHFVTETFRESRSSYVTRITSLLESAATTTPHAAMFPALAFVADRHVRLDEYAAACGDLPCVVTGTMTLGARDSVERGLVVIERGRVTHHFRHDQVGYFTVDGTPYFGAISSNIRQLSHMNAPSNVPVSTRAVVIDCGHHQYNGRYPKVMRAAARRASTMIGAPAVCPLSFWRFHGGRNAYGWVEGSESATWSVARVHRDGVCRGDSIDIVDMT